MLPGRTRRARVYNDVEYNAASIPTKLPLIDMLADNYEVVSKQPLAHCLFMAVQHLQGSFVPLLHAIVAAGVPYEYCFLIGKAYSSHPLVLDYLKRLGCIIDRSDCMKSFANSYEREMEDRIDHMLQRICNLLDTTPNTTVVLLDEGGKAVRALHERYQSYAPRFRCVEQTTRGIKEIHHLPLIAPVINIARSWGKQRIEGPLIADSMAQGLATNLDRWKHVFTLASTDVLVFGYGVVGRLVTAELLRQGYQVTIYDSDKAALEEARFVGRRIWDDSSNLATFSLIMSCTGSPSLSERDLGQLKSSALLVNGASSDIEFPAGQIRSIGEIIYSRGAPEVSTVPFQPWLNLYRAVYAGQTIHLANGGFPINFSGELDSVAPEKFQVTRALMYLGAIQAVSTNQIGIIDLDHTGQELIIHSFVDLNLS